MRSLLTLLLITFGLTPLAQADDEKILTSFSRILPGEVVTSIQETPIPGLYEVMSGTRVFYASEDGAFLLTGHLIDMQAGLDLTEPRIQEARVDLYKGLNEKDMLIYGDKNLEHTVTVFTDIDCPYCRKLHEQMAEYNKEGIRVRYMMYPRAGLNSSSYIKARNAWCADDPHAAMTQAKQGKKLPDKDCKNPIAEHMKVAKALGVNATPTIITESVDIIPGMIPPKRLAAVLRAQKAERQADK